MVSANGKFFRPFVYSEKIRPPLPRCRDLGSSSNSASPHLRNAQALNRASKAVNGRVPYRKNLTMRMHLLLFGLQRIKQPALAKTGPLPKVDYKNLAMRPNLLLEYHHPQPQQGVSSTSRYLG